MEHQQRVEWTLQLLLLFHCATEFGGKWICLQTYLCQTKRNWSSNLRQRSEKFWHDLIIWNWPEAKRSLNSFFKTNKIWATLNKELVLCCDCFWEFPRKIVFSSFIVKRRRRLVFKSKVRIVLTFLFILHLGLTTKFINSKHKFE